MSGKLKLLTIIYVEAFHCLVLAVCTGFAFIQMRSSSSVFDPGRVKVNTKVLNFLKTECLVKIAPASICKEKT